MIPILGTLVLWEVVEDIAVSVCPSLGMKKCYHALRKKVVEICCVESEREREPDILCTLSGGG